MTKFKTHLKRARRGVAYLNEHEPNWFWNVRLSLLDMGNSHYCVLGQLYDELRNWDFTAKAAGFSGRDDPRLVKLGFTYAAEQSSEAEDREAEALTLAWSQVITELRGADSSERTNAEPEFASEEPFLELTDVELLEVIQLRRDAVAEAEQALDDAELALRNILRFAGE